MKTKVVQKTLSNVHLLDRNAIVLHEQLALRRLKELEPEAAAPAASGGRWNRRRLWQLPLAILAASFKPARLMIETAPGQPPAEWHEVERARHLRATMML